MSGNVDRSTLEEQGTAAWIAYLNQLRLSKLANQLTEIQRDLSEALRGQKVNLSAAFRTLDLTAGNIQALIEINRGGEKGLHGFIAEPAQAGIGNAWKQVFGEKAIYKWINDNGTWDLIKIDPSTGQRINLQLKFNINIANTIKAFKDFIGKYSSSIRDTDKILIPKDRYQHLLRLLNMSEQEANTLATETGEFSRSDWKLVQGFFGEHPEMINRISPSDLDYAEVQKGKIFDTLAKEKAEIKSASKQIDESSKAAAKEKKSAAYTESQPSWAEAAKVTTVSIALESATAFLVTYMHIRQEKKLNEFTSEDWKKLGLKTGKGAISGMIRGAAIYSLTNFASAPASLVSGLVTAVISVTELATSYHSGLIELDEFLALSEESCIDAAVSAVSAMVGEVLIPIPILGALIGTVAGRLATEIAKKYCQESEQFTIIGCQAEFEKSCLDLGEDYKELASILDARISHFHSITELLLDENMNLAFYQSTVLADSVGVTAEMVLRNKQDIDNYFER